MGNLVEGCFCDNCNKEEINEDEEDYKEEDTNNSDIKIGFNNNRIGYYSRKEIPKNIVEVKFNIDSLVREHYGNPFDIYQELEELGEGAYGVVKKVCLKDNPETVRAMKIISKDCIEEGHSEKLLDEIKILSSLEHPNIMKIFEYFDDSTYIYIVSELCDQGDLLGKIAKLGSMSELFVKFLMGQIFNAVFYLHEHGIFHGDIKLENIMLYKTSRKKGRRFTKLNKELNSSVRLQKDIEGSYRLGEKNLSSLFVEDMTNYEVKIIDFGCSKFLHKGIQNKLSGIVGTSIYCSPEVIDNLYDEKSDEWSCGILMYILLCGEPPFTGESEEEIFANIKKGYIDFNKKNFNNVSDNCINLIKGLLNQNRKQRISAEKALNHPFFTKDFNPKIALTQNKDLNILKKFLTLEKLPSKLHEVVVAYCCYNFINKEEEKKLRELFRYLDQENKNRLRIEDFSFGFRQANILVSKYELKKIQNLLDSDGNNSIEYQEFLRAVCDKDDLFKTENLKIVFGFIDKDKKGYANTEDIQNFVLGNKISKSVNRRSLIGSYAQIGMKKKTHLTFEQFCDIIRNNKKLQINDSDSSTDSENEEIFKGNVNPKKNNLSSRNVIREIENNKMLYNMTEGDEVVVNPKRKFYRKKTTNI